MNTHPDMTPTQLEEAARFLWGRFWIERLSRSIRIRHRDIQDMLSGDVPIPDTVRDALVDAMLKRRGEVDQRLRTLSGIAA